MRVDQKEGHSYLHSLEERFKQWAVPRVPSYIETHHLTFATALWSALMIASGIWAYWWRGALVLGVPLIVLQYITDVLDGAIGRERNTGLVSWGWYADHLLDFVFIGAVMMAAVAATLGNGGVLALFLPLGPLVCITHAYVLSAIVQQVRIYYMGFGPTEGRIYLMGVLGVLAYCPSALVPWAVVVISLLQAVAAWALVVRAHGELWSRDLAHREWPNVVLIRTTQKLVEKARRRAS